MSMLIRRKNFRSKVDSIRNSSRKCNKNPYVKYHLGMIITCLFFFHHNQQARTAVRKKLLQFSDIDLPTAPSYEGLKTDNILPKWSKQRSICSSSRDLLTLNETVLALAQQEAHEFHNLGGSLKAYEELLNAQIDKTYKRAGTNFIPDKQETPLKDNESINDFIINAKRTNDYRLRGGYGDRKAYGKFQNSGRSNERDNEGRVDTFEPRTQFQRWKVGMGPIASDVCKKYMDTSKQTFKGLEFKLLCESPQLMKQKEAQESSGKKDESECHILSIGSNGQWGFEEAIVDRSSCQVHTFDCTIKNPKKPQNDNIHFYPYCIGHTDKVDKDREYLTFWSMIKKAKMMDAPVIFKMDAEGFEYDVLTQMLKEATTSENQNMLPAQISIELHYGTRMYDLPWIMRWRNTGEIALFSAMMYNAGGYLPVRIEGPSGCDACMEVLYVRVFCD